MEMSGLLHALASLFPEGEKKDRGAKWTGNWIGHWYGLDTAEKKCPVTTSSLTTIQHNICSTNCIMIYSSYGISFVYEVNIVITMFWLRRRVAW
jgi:hypothetical protein